MGRHVVRLANARGVPGTAGPLVEDPRGKRYLLCNHHVLFGLGARREDRVWALPDDGPFGGDAVFLGRTAGGQLGRVTWAGETVFVDCALVAIDPQARFPAWLERGLADAAVGSADRAARGAPVRKHGGATGTTDGRVIDTAFSDRPAIDGTTWKAPGQMLIDSTDPELNFSAPGDSGAAVLDGADRVVGLLWGCNANGQGIASPIAPVLECLGVALAAAEGKQP